MRPSNLGIILLLSVAACGSRPASSAASDTAKTTKTGPSDPAPVVVALVVDQLSAWVAAERLPALPKDGFFGRIVSEGTYATNMRYPYAITDTAPGHASLHTGHTPNESHILVNETPDEKTGRRASFFRDPATKLVGPEGPLDEMGSSAKALAVKTVADRLRERHPKAKILSVSLKDRAALIPAGQHPDHAIWFNGKVDSFVTSTAIEASFPPWAAPIGDNAAVRKARAQPWVPLDRKWLETNAGRDDAPGEGNLDGMGTTFPHTVTTPWAFRATPFSDPMILDMALAGVKATRDPSEPLLLLVSLSSSDTIGHTFGPSSWESWDHLLRLDRELARFLRELETLVGTTPAVLLSGDHGNSPMPEARIGCKQTKEPAVDDPWDRPCGGGGRLVPDPIREELRNEAEHVLGDANVIAGVSDGYVFLSAAGRALPAPDRTKLDALVNRVLKTKHGKDVAEIYDARDLAAKCPAALAKAPPAPRRAKESEGVLTLVCRSWTPNAGAGDYYVVPAPGSFFDGEIVAGHGGSHGTPWKYDRLVPLFVRGPHIAAGAKIEEPVDFTAYSAIEAAFLGLSSGHAGEALDAARAR